MKQYEPYQQVYDLKNLFEAVQMSQVFADGKTFVDCTPKFPLSEIQKEYDRQSSQPGFDLVKFVHDNFLPPKVPHTQFEPNSDIVAHINHLWRVLRREPDLSSNNSLIDLPYPYVVPGGRFREIYYWDSYFTMLGLAESGEHGLIENMVDNFSFLIHRHGHVPNGNRTYYLSRSQPPFFAAMVNLLASLKGREVLQKYEGAMEKEYEYWMKGMETLNPLEATNRVLMMEDRSVLNRYWDDKDNPREESFREDVKTAEEAINYFLMVTTFQDASQQSVAVENLRREVYRHLRAGAESGYDFSSRWFADGQNLHTIVTTQIVPVDLNCLLYHMEETLSYSKAIHGNSAVSRDYQAKADIRKKAILRYCYNPSLKFFTDYHLFKEMDGSITPAGMYPFCFFHEDISPSITADCLKTLKSLIKGGGIVTSCSNTGQQWDAPNGWAPLQYMTIWALQNLGEHDLARDIALRWVKLNIDVFRRTGKLMEKYNVIDLELEAGGGEYPAQDGFGWTNGVLLKLISMYELEG